MSHVQLRQTSYFMVFEMILYCQHINNNWSNHLEIVPPLKAEMISFLYPAPGFPHETVGLEALTLGR